MNNRINIFLVLASFYFISSTLAIADSDVTGIPNEKASQAHNTTEIVILGTLHGQHRDNKAYPFDTLRAIIEALEPSAILVEMPPEIGGHVTVKNGRIAKNFTGNENTVANQAADNLGVELIPYDREGRNELYKASDYFRRQKHAYDQIDVWAKELAQEDLESIEVTITGMLYPSVNMSQGHLMRNAGPTIINSRAYDLIILNKKCIQHRLWPKLLTQSDHEELAQEFIFFRKEWEERNQIMADNIRVISKKYVGKRLVVLCGAEHRYILRDILSRTAGIVIKEFYEIPGCDNSGITNNMASKTKVRNLTLKKQETGEHRGSDDTVARCE